MLDREHRAYADARRLSRVEGVLRDLWRRLANGEDVGDRLDEIYLAATGRTDDTDAPLEIMLGIAFAAHHLTSMQRWPDLGLVEPSDAKLVRLATIDIEHVYPKEYAQLRGRSELIVKAVRAWRGRGRQRRGEPRKWAAVAAVLEAAGFTDLDERRLQKRWERRRKK